MSLRDEMREYFTKTSLRGKMPENFSDDYNLIKREVLDSMDYIELITHIENNYHIELEEDEIVPENFASIATLARFIESKLA